jgi:hypothetical protein
MRGGGTEVEEEREAARGGKRGKTRRVEASTYRVVRQRRVAVLAIVLWHPCLAPDAGFSGKGATGGSMRLKRGRDENKRKCGEVAKFSIQLSTTLQRPWYVLKLCQIWCLLGTSGG